MALEEKRGRAEEELLNGTLDRDAYKRCNEKIEVDLVNIQQELIDVDKN